MALEKIIGGILGLVAGIALAAQVNAQEIEYKTDLKTEEARPTHIIELNNGTRIETDLKTGKQTKYWVWPKYEKTKSIDTTISGDGDNPNIKRYKPSQLEIANQEFANKDYQNALIGYQKILKNSKKLSSKIDLFYQIGLCYDNMDASGSGSNNHAQINYEKAAQIGEQLLSQGKYDPKKLAQIYAQWARGPNWQDYVKKLTRASELDPSNNIYQKNIKVGKTL